MDGDYHVIVVDSQSETLIGQKLTYFPFPFVSFQVPFFVLKLCTLCDGIEGEG